jgi:2-keto-4-pentenoate hydratase/2-oxohepta-3-ene-1,7-dioic acid hydratase in catechol pathway
VNGKTRQSSNTADMIFDVRTLIEFLSGGTTLYQGTVILTGTPSGVGMAMDPPQYLAPGDVVEIEIEKIGVLRNPVVAEE